MFSGCECMCVYINSLASTLFKYMCVQKVFKYMEESLNLPFVYFGYCLTPKRTLWKSDGHLKYYSDIDGVLYRLTSSQKV